MSEYVIQKNFYIRKSLKQATVYFLSIESVLKIYSINVLSIAKFYMYVKVTVAHGSVI